MIIEKTESREKLKEESKNKFKITRIHQNDLKSDVLMSHLLEESQKAPYLPKNENLKELLVLSESPLTKK